MNKKRNVVLFLIIVVVGILTINEFLFPIYRDWCHCRDDYTAGLIVCAEQCPNDGSCGVNFGFSGYCDWGNCVWDAYYDCIDTEKSGQTNYMQWGGCVDCLIW